jgi:rare lipoprotein A (peptidoglycan hydrolase)
MELSVAGFIRLGTLVTCVAALMAAGCSTARLADLDGPQYTGGPQQAMAAKPAPDRGTGGLSAPLYPVQRSDDATIRYYPREQTSARPGAQAVASYGASPPAQTDYYRGRPGDDRSAAVASVPRGTSGRVQPSYRQHGVARWMGASWAGHVTTTQERFDPDRLTGAHASLPLPSYLYVTNRTNGRTVLIRINDRPSAAAGRGDGTVVVVSRRVADLLDFSRHGSTNVELQYAGPAGLRSSGQHEESFLRRQPWYGPRAGRMAQAGSEHAGASGHEATNQRYPPPAYPRWDNTQRAR